MGFLKPLSIDQRATTLEAQTEQADLALWKHVSQSLLINTINLQELKRHAPMRQRLIDAVAARAEI